MQKIRAKIRLQHIRDNADAFIRRTGVKLCAVVKADAYGHGAEQIVDALCDKADCFAVSLVDEALKIRIPAVGKEILVLTPPLCEEEIYTACKNAFILTVDGLHTAFEIVSVCKRYQLTARVHLKGNTGMNRYGMGLSELGKVCRYLQNQPCVLVQGFYSHLYDCNPKTAWAQRALFLRQLAVCKRYFPQITAHLSATYGALLGKEFAFDMVRIGIGLYGYLPNTESVKPFPLKRAMRVYACVVATRKYAFGGAGYGTPYFKAKPEHVSLLRAGYADGFLRQRENGTKGSESHLNNLCMDACLRNGRISRKKWVLLMDDADEVAKKTGTISYEVLCRIAMRAERIYDYERENDGGEKGVARTDESNSRKPNSKPRRQKKSDG